MLKKVSVAGLLILLAGGAFVFMATRSSASFETSAAEQLKPIPSDGATRYLMFQVFSGNRTVEIPWDNTQPLVRTPKDSVAQLVDDIVTTIGTRGTTRARLGFVLGPLAFDHSDEDVRGMIKDAFAIAREKNIAVGFHLDDAMFWLNRKDLMSNPRNVEWIDWEGTPNEGLAIDWGKKERFPPRMCLNSPEIKAEVTRRARDVIGAEIKAQVDQLEREGRPELFGAVIIGWESHMGHDSATDERLGFCALSNAGFSPQNRPPSFGEEVQKVIQQSLEQWAKGLRDAGIPKEKLYAHINFLPESTFRSYQKTHPTLFFVKYTEVVNTAPSSAHPAVAFGANYLPGFSIYANAATMNVIHAELQKHGNPHWAQSEGTNVIPGLSGANASGGGADMETYLAQKFNYGATVVNIFAWGIGGDAFKDSPFRTATQSNAAIAAYRKFLNLQ